MPIYEYGCTACGHNFEMMQKVSDEPVSICPECGAKTEKLMSTSAFVLKGGGWHADGYSKEKEKPKSCDSSSSPACASCPSAA